VNFDVYLVSKKIDSDAFKQAEKDLWLSWQVEFEQLHPNSFTAQKLYLINPVRRKYPLKVEIKKEVVEVKNQEQPETSLKEPGTLNLEPETTEPKPQSSKPVIPRPVFKQPKPKIN
jgi:hypothetical protein